MLLSYHAIVNCGCLVNLIKCFRFEEIIFHVTPISAAFSNRFRPKHDTLIAWKIRFGEWCRSTLPSSLQDVLRWDRVVEKTTLVSGWLHIQRQQKNINNGSIAIAGARVSPFLELSDLAEILAAEQEPSLPELARGRSCSLGAPDKSHFSMDHRQLFSCSFFFVWFNVNINFGGETGGEWNKKICKFSQKNPQQKFFFLILHWCKNDRMSFLMNSIFFLVNFAMDCVTFG